MNFDWLKNLHKLFHRKEQFMTYAVTPAPTSNTITQAATQLQLVQTAHSLQTAHSQALAQYNATNQQAGYRWQTARSPTYISTPAAGGLYSGVNSAGLGYPVTQPLGYILLPYPTGMTTSMTLTDALGFHHNIIVDNAYHAVFMTIMQTMNGYTPVLTAASGPAPSKMLEGDFSEDEMDKAERLIEELNGEKEGFEETAGAAQV